MNARITLLWLWFPASVALIVYLASLYLYRLFFHPLAKFPGPKLAALSNWYEFYYDVFLQGKFTTHLQELHKQYGLHASNFPIPTSSYLQ